MSLDNHEYHESFLNYLLRDILREFDSIIFLTTLCVEIILFRFINFSFFFFFPSDFSYSFTSMHRYRSNLQDIDVEIELTANHLGRFEMYLCPNNNPRNVATQECFDR